MARWPDRDWIDNVLCEFHLMQLEFHLMQCQATCVFHLCWYSAEWQYPRSGFLISFVLLCHIDFVALVFYLQLFLGTHKP